MRQALRNLLDEEFSNEEKDKIIEALRSFSDLKGVHELKTRRAGEKGFIQFHIELDPNMTLLKAHIISDQISEKIEHLFPRSEVIIHQDPHGVEEETNYKIKFN